MLLSKYVKKQFDGVLRTRYDQNPAYRYLSPADFDGMQYEPHDIMGANGILLKGYFYYMGEKRTDRIVVFDHGMGPGHRSYFKEISMLILHGYTVYSYDHTGCNATAGDTIVSFGQSLDDLDHVMTALEQDENLQHATFSVVGHSWGGFSTLNIGALHPNITHLVAMSGFISVDAVMEQYLPGLLRPYRKEAYEREKEYLPAYTDYNAMESLQKTDAKLLVIHSTDDKMVSYPCNFLPLAKALAGRADTEFVTMHGKKHHPYYADGAVVASSAYYKRMEKAYRKKQLVTKQQQKAFRDSQPWDEITEQDSAIWQKIFDFLDN